MSKMSSLAFLALQSGALMISAGGTSPAFAQSQNASGRITLTTSSAEMNFAFRIGLQQNGVDQLSNCNNSFAYFNKDDSNYQVKVASLMTAFAQKSTVSIDYTKNASGWCLIGDITVYG